MACRRQPPLLAALLLTVAAPGSADDVHVAVASNFVPVLTELAPTFSAQTGHRLLPSAASTGKLYAQIRQGAPFAVFLSADSRHAERLEAEGHAVRGSRFTYALGQLVLWSPDVGRIDADGAVLRAGRFDRLALANPRLAPYGLAAQQALERLGLWEALQSRLVQGENIAQAYQFVASGAAPLGFVAASQLADTGAGGSSWTVPATLYDPIEQQAVLLRDEPPARAFLTFPCEADSQTLIARRGYTLPSRCGPSAASAGH